MGTKVRKGRGTPVMMKRFPQQPSMLKNPKHSDAERLIGCAIKRANGQVTIMRQGSHSQLREYKPKDPTDLEGFMTSAGRFVDREEAQGIAIKAQQIRGRMQRELLSSDIQW